jgi:hypothetical protein
VLGLQKVPTTQGSSPLLFFFFFFLVLLGFIQGLTLASQALYYLSHSTSPPLLLKSIPSGSGLGGPKAQVPGM